MIVNRLTANAPALAAMAAGLLIGAVPAGASVAGTVQPIASIRAAAEAGMRGILDPGLSGVQLEAMALDPRLRLPSCQERLGTYATVPRHNQARVPVRVTCGAPAWTVHVPVDIRRTHAVLVLKRAVGRGERGRGPGHATGGDETRDDYRDAFSAFRLCVGRRHRGTSCGEKGHAGLHNRRRPRDDHGSISNR